MGSICSLVSIAGKLRSGRLVIAKIRVSRLVLGLVFYGNLNIPEGKLFRIIK